eukprot:TRINITY_DN10985_c0_g1_i2.p1 TRINITY_DN10985_c0_g1~~TRINITY_DN10985_c0_g1_i2.p1  ORF type:complete len:190 (-),score=38.95 TRINITY_DN10985_c0_g1_i2:101-643(-)
MEVQLAPMRTMEDFILTQSRFQAPDVKNVEKFFNRIVSNLLYYQTNYFASFLVMFCLVSMSNPGAMISAMLTLALVFGLLYYGSANNDKVREFKTAYPGFTMLGSFFVGYYLIMHLGSLSVLFTSVGLPFMFMIAHASLRLRNLKNKVTNVADLLGVSKPTPMGVLLKEWGINPDLKYIS